MSILDSTVNFAKGVVSTGYNSSATSIVLQSGNGAKFPSTPFNVVWWNCSSYPDPSDDPNVEVVRVTNVSTDTLTVTRAQEGTSASNKNTSGVTYTMIAGLTSHTVGAINTALGQLFVGLNDVNTVSFSSTPTFNASLGGVQYLTLTGNVSSSSTSNLTAGQFVTFIIAQNGTGGYTFSWPSNVYGSVSVNTTASAVTVQTFISPDGSNLYACSIGQVSYA